jgi:hypothetical protein
MFRHGTKPGSHLCILQAIRSSQRHGDEALETLATLLAGKTGAAEGVSWLTRATAARSGWWPATVGHAVTAASTARPTSSAGAIAQQTGGLGEIRWRHVESPVSVAGQIVMHGLAPLVIAQILLGLQRRCRLDAAKTKDSDLRRW